MSVVVRMEMPLNCFECPMYDWNRQKLCCNAHLDLRPIPNGGAPKPDWCPVICELPEGHGRLVDADAFLKFMFEYDDYEGEKEAHDLDLIHRDSICYAIEEAPTIVPAEAERSKA